MQGLTSSGLAAGSTTKATGLHGLSQLNGPLQSCSEKGYEKGQQVSYAAEAVAANGLGLPDVLQRGHHLRHKGNGDGSNHPRLVQESRCEAQHLVVIDQHIEGRKYEEYGYQAESTSQPVDQGLQCGIAAELQKRHASDAQ